MVNNLLPLLLQRLLQSSAEESVRSGVGKEGEFTRLLQGWLMASPSTPFSSVEGTSDFFSVPAWNMLLEMVIRQNVMDSTDKEGPGAERSEETLFSHSWPVQGRLTQEFHAHHHGIDIGVPVGTPIKTTIGGRVVYAGWNNQGYGNLVIVENGPWRTYYAHLSEMPVRVGQWVEAGEVIGLSGNTGNSTGPHLHYEVRRNGVPVHPDELLMAYSQT